MYIKDNKAFINHFIIDLTKLIGQGQFGKIFECTSTQSNLIKYCAKMIQLNSENEKFCQREKDISEFIKNNKGNNNLVSVFHVEYLQQQKLFVLIMERCDSSLQDLWSKKKQFNDQEISTFITQFLNGYKFLYINNIVHKDIKPDNILYTIQNNSPIYKIGDFGLAKIYKINQPNDDISRNGTAVYSAPEVSLINQDEEIQKKLLDIKNIHAKSRIDIYSLGIIIYQMIFGNFPFDLNAYSISKFFDGLKKRPLKITEKNSIHIELVEKMLVYDPTCRLDFSDLFRNFNINIPPQMVQKIDSNQNIFTMNNKINQMNQFNQGNQFNQMNQFNQGNQFNQRNQFNQANQFNLKNQNNQANQFNLKNQNNQANCLNNQFNKIVNPIKPENHYQNIKDFLNYLKCDLYYSLNDPMKQLIENINKSPQINQFQIQQIQKYFPFEPTKIEEYRERTLKFQYSLICILRKPQECTLDFTNIDSIKNDLRSFYQKRN